MATAHPDEVTHEIGGDAPAPAGRHARDLTTGPIGTTLVLFALPTLASNILQSLNGSINAIWVGRFLGESALAATSNANLVMFLMFSAVFGFGMAATILVGQHVGGRDIDAARRVLGTAAGAFVLMAAVIATVGWIATPALLRLLATPTEAQPLAVAYLRVIFLMMPGAFLTVLLMMGLRGFGDSLTPLWFMVLSVVLDSGLNPVFILGLGPAPRMGIAGAATATAIATYVSLAALIVTIYVRDLADPAARAGAALSAAYAGADAHDPGEGHADGAADDRDLGRVAGADRAGQSAGKRDHRRLRRHEPALGLCADAGDGAGRGRVRDGRAEYRRGTVGSDRPGDAGRDHYEPGDHIRDGAGDHAGGSRGAGAVPGRGQPCDRDRGAYPQGRGMELRAAGRRVRAVRDGARERLGVRAAGDP